MIGSTWLFVLQLVDRLRNCSTEQEAQRITEGICDYVHGELTRSQKQLAQLQKRSTEDYEQLQKRSTEDYEQLQKRSKEDYAQLQDEFQEQSSDYRRVKEELIDTKKQLDLLQTEMNRQNDASSAQIKQRSNTTPTGLPPTTALATVGGNRRARTTSPVVDYSSSAARVNEQASASAAAILGENDVDATDVVLPDTKQNVQMSQFDLIIWSTCLVFF